jgi:chromosome segregation ATPase
VRVDVVEEAIVERLPERLRDAPAGSRDAELDQQVLDAGERLSRTAEELENVERAIKGGGEARRLVAMLQELEGQWEEARDTLRRLEARRAEIAGRTVHARIARVEEALEATDEAADVASINAALLTVFRRVVVDYRSGLLEFEYVHGGSVEVPYAWPQDSDLP